MSDEIIVFNREGAEQYKKIAREVARRMQNETPHRARWQQNGGRDENRLQVKLKEDLFAAVNTDTDPSFGQAFIRRKVGANLVVTTEEITLVNRFKNISFDKGLYAKAEKISGEWQLYAADCPPGEESI